MKDLQGKVAFITGGGSGIGLGQARVFAEECGMKVVIADVRQDHLDEAIASFSGKNVEVHPIRLDLTDRAAYAAAAEEVEARIGPVYLLCNTAGVCQFGAVEKATFDDWDWQLDVNLGGVINGVATFVPRMIRHGGGHIVVTASMSSFVAAPATAIYCTTKFAVRGLAESLRIEMPRYNIGVTLLCPGGVNTNINRSVEARPDRYAETGYYGSDEQVFEDLRKVTENGFDPVELARILRDGVVNDRFWVFPYPEFAENQEARNRELIEAMLSYSDDPSYLRRMAHPTRGLGKMPELD